MEFSIGEVVISPSHGVGHIDSTLQHEGKEGWKILMESGETLFVPLTKMDVAIRKPVSPAKAKVLLDILKNSSFASDAPVGKWEEILKELNPEPAARKLRSLYNQSPNFSMLDRRLIFALENVLIGEIALVCGLSRTDLEVELKAQRDINLPKPM
jgi:RNA polymerase-interacting CarD/CdnL/TRCF family regulator